MRQWTATRDTQEAYGSVSIALHWCVAVIVLCLIALGLLMQWPITFENEALYLALKNAHISVGVLLCVALVPRLIWRWSSRRPAPVEQRRTQHVLSVVVQGLLLLALVCQAFSGMFARWTALDWQRGGGAESVPFFGLFELPSSMWQHLPEWNRVAENVHDRLAVVVMALLGVLVLGALKHALLDRPRRFRMENAGEETQISPR